MLHFGSGEGWWEGRGEGLLGAVDPEGLPQRSLRPLRLEGDKKRSDRNGLKSTVPWSLYHYELPRPQKDFHLQESSMNEGDNLGLNSALIPSSGIHLLWGVWLSPYTLLEGMFLPLWHPHQP